MRMKLSLLLVMLCLLLSAFSPGYAQSREMEHYLLVGVDGWGLNEEGGARSDAIILASLDYEEDRVLFTSFARDSLVKPSYRKDFVKLNTLVRASAGEHMLIDYLEETFGIPINGYFVINFSGAVDVINALGGIDVELSQEEVVYLDEHSGIGRFEEYPLSEGVCRINGAQAIYYMRCRSLDSDFGRQRRHGKVLEGVMNRVSDVSLVEALTLFDDVLGMYRTDMSVARQIGLIYRAIALQDAQVELHALPQEVSYRYAKDSSGASGLSFDEKLCRAQLYAWLGIEDPQTEALIREQEEKNIQPEKTPIVFAP